MRLWTAQAVSSLGSAMSFLVFPLVGLALTGSVLQAGLVGSAFAAASTLGRLPGGVLADQWDRKRVMTSAQVVCAALYASAATAQWAGVLTLPHLLAVAIATGLAKALFDPAETAAVRSLVPSAQLPEAYSQTQVRQQAAQLAGPPLGGALYAVQPWLPFLVDAASYAFSCLVLNRIVTPLPAPVRRSGTSLRRDLVEGLRFLWARPFFRAYLAYAALTNFALLALFLVIVLKLSAAGAAPAQIGAVETAAALGGLVGAVAAPALIRRVPSGLLAIATAVVLGVVVLPMALTDDPWLVGGLFAIAMLVHPAGVAAISAYVSAITPDGLQGRVGAGLTFGATVIQPLGPLTGGALLHGLGASGATLAAAALAAAASLPLLLSREVRSLPTPDGWDEDVCRSAVDATDLITSMRSNRMTGCRAR
ncbi:MFS transporter [Angustibacter luteus]